MDKNSSIVLIDPNACIQQEYLQQLNDILVKNDNDNDIIQKPNIPATCQTVSVAEKANN